MALPASVSALPHPVRVADLIERLASEIEEIAFCADALQDLAGATAVRLNGAERARLIAGIQDLDRLVQRLQGLAAFLNALQDSMPQGLTLDAAPALARLSLASQAAALRGVREAAADGDRDVFFD